jgi:hypothetical protein
MKIVSKSLVFLFILSWLSACKNAQNGEILPQVNVEEGKYNMKIYDSSGKLVLERYGDAKYTGHKDQISLYDPMFGQGDNYFSSLVIDHQDNIKSGYTKNYFSVSTLDENKIYSGISKLWYSVEGDWSYSLEKGKIQIVNATKDKISGILKFNMKSYNNFRGKNIKWGDNIRIEAEFFAK